jgi:hypothetical protein
VPCDGPAEVSGRAASAGRYGQHQQADRGNHAGPYVRKLAGPAGKPRARQPSATRRGTSGANAPVRFMLSPEELQRVIQVRRDRPTAAWRSHATQPRERRRSQL